METTCLSEAMYLLERALRTRGISPVIEGGRTFHVKHGAGRFSLNFMPGNRRVLISSKVSVEAEERGKGVGRRLLNLREEIAKEIGVNLLLATVRNDNAVENHLLETSGWKKMTNRGTGVSLWGKEL